MNKLGKKLLAIGLAAMTTISMCIPAFAATDTAGSVTVKIQMDGQTYIQETINIADIEAKLAEDNVGHFYEISSQYTNYNNDGVKDPTVADALIYAYNEYYMEYVGEWTDAYYDKDYETLYVANDNYALSYAWDNNYYTDPNTNITYTPGMYFLYFDGLTTKYLGQQEDGSYGYEAWQLSMNGVVSPSYASSNALYAGEEIVFNYTEQYYY